ncbi:DUF6722 family protein [Hallella seregens]|uniref:DUF6722 family protein n=1 Tax=Hallella seregens ATCC 51272 TaxID=1336250 RepID=A0ABV5ZME2_9BACT|nr:DUF6722 family protein [Hallella seregens]
MKDKTKEKIGDWLLDVAKYIFTAVLLSTLFSGIATWKWYWYILIAIIVLSIVVIGLKIINSTGNKKRR